MDLTYMRYLFLCLPLISSLTYAAQIKFPAELIPLQVDSKKIEHSLFSKVDEIELKKGVHKLKIKYSDLFELDYDDHEIVESNPFWVEILVSEGEKYQMVFNKPEDEIEPRDFAKSPSVMLEIISTGKLVEATKSSKLAELVTPIKASEVIKAPKALHMLKYWWQQASEEERKVFLKEAIK